MPTRLQNRPGSIKDAAISVCSQIPQGADVALFGHSFGAAIAAETARLLLSNGRNRLVWLGLSGWTGPHRGDANLDVEHSDDWIRAELERLGGITSDLLGSVEFRTRVLPIIRAQWSALDRYDPDIDLGDIPITWMAGRDDPHTMSRTRCVRSTRTTTRIYSGGHFYLFQNPAPVIATIAVAIRNAQETVTKKESPTHAVFQPRS